MSFNGYNFSNIANLVNHVGFSKYVLDVEKVISMSSNFRLVREKVYLRDKNLFQIRVDEADIYDMLNTISVLMSTEIYCNFYKWKFKEDMMGHSLTLPIEDFRRLQKGFTTEMMMLKAQHKLKTYKNNPRFPWILRCLTDLDDFIYSKGIRCMYYHLTSNMQDTHNSYLSIRRWKRLSLLLSHMKHWREKAFTPGFLSGLITFLSPSNVKQIIFVSKRACELMKCNFGCPFKCPEEADKFHFTIKKGDESTMNLYYKWLLSKTPDEALEIFCGVHNNIEYKTSKKRKKSEEEKTISRVDSEILIHYKNVYSQGNPVPITNTKVELYMNLLDIVYYVFNAKKYSDWESLPKNELYNVMRDIIKRGVVGKFTPIAALSRKTNENHKCLRQSDIFPIINIPNDVKERLKDINIDYNKIFC